MSQATAEVSTLTKRKEMMDKQHTIKKAVSITGVGLHSGQEVTLTFKPAPINHGYKFKRIDIEGEPTINADADLVVEVARGTTLQQNGAKVSTVEHALAALCGLQIDNVLIELDGQEVPIMDGSAKFFIDALEEAGLEAQDADRNYFELDTNIRYSDPVNKVEILAVPDDEYKLTVMIDYNSPVLGTQHASLNHISDFKDYAASSRTFCFLHELELLLEHNLIKGGDLNNAIVVVDKVVSEEQLDHLAKLFNKPKVAVKEEGILNNVELRHRNEPARHKLLDVVGDLALVGRPIKAKITASRPGHSANVEFAKKLKAYIKQKKNTEDIPKYDPLKKPLYDLRQIEATLPHRYPFLLVDKIIELSEQHVVGIKNVTFNEPYFPGHFPGNPVMPGVLQLEALAQTGGILVLNTVPDPENYDTYFLMIDEAKFKNKVVPGDTLILKMELLSPIRRGICEMRGTAYVGDKIASSAKLVAKIMRRETA
ncbi:MAG: bifunctional UDP-3-O-[3-hydroxymyristoyl] N-acetylglucosamine deacetylase/3-hydroxyacyl-ACP dehydratase [Chitinophagales bacterium]|nr:bifunctional UDP-3-O-[3-hydroxymyristoyl] N-acetylglucosamine deacetylase/3-hydroxyacyl-ACP dehydratase [Chitinophagales bacterium]